MTTEPSLRPSQHRCPVCRWEIASNQPSRCRLCVGLCGSCRGSDIHPYAAGSRCDRHLPVALPRGDSVKQTSFQAKVATIMQTTHRRPAQSPATPVVAGMVVPDGAKRLKVAAGDPWAVTAAMWHGKLRGTNGAYSEAEAQTVKVAGIEPLGAEFVALWTDGHFSSGWIFGAGQDFRTANSKDLETFVRGYVTEPEGLF